MDRRTISVIDYGAGNIASVVNMIRHVGGEADVISSPHDLAHVEKLLLPGVGAFDHAMECLKRGGWLNELNKCVLEREIPVMGICLGMQLMCKSSEEGVAQGLGWVDAQVLKFDFQADSVRLKVPHMGWNAASVVKSDPLFVDLAIERRFYFVHSYYVDCRNERDVLLSCNYGRRFVAGFRSKNIWGFQFHPEKSHKFGMEIFKRFLEV